ncbi:MAG: hypothetical protein AAB212_07890 [Bacteroidota bacterium]
MRTKNLQKAFLVTDYENKSEPLASKKVFYNRLYKNAIVATVILSICLAIGVVGYHFSGPMDWIDALHNASMILSGMGPVAEIKTTIGKIFSSFYALFSGVAFITNIGVLIAPVAHRFFHILHAEE